MSNHHRAGTLATDDSLVTVTPETAGWTYSGLEVFDLGPGPVERTLDGLEAVLVPLSATDVEVVVDDESLTLAGRTGVFAAVSDWAYLPLGSRVRISGNGGEVALCTARATERFPLRVTAAADVPVEVRGGGRASRQVTNIATPDSFPTADRINVCEVLTPGGNVSSWPPHRHDGIGDCEPTNEEVYYFRTGRLDGEHGHPHGQGLFRVYTVDGSSDETVTVLDGDVHLVGQGYHGPSTAQPEYPMYFLNVLAGPASERTMAFCDDPDHHWVREAWEVQEQDPRLPLTSADGQVAR
ncbi:5-deoxy-glucuronate isomerase [Phycicoccus flavus]|uniref:5-deoxy-glucuronate isomerase n=1 Tax=Phycicoccus flavus TaxID=2502783 RepID=A0A8T6R4L0_9MICO|nr:5-deoxy-glucuronate isomerase [Phycicoccus flavus]NHA67735.1 5-deoxy-glucuronate isomerase [Phycicoccus flavus]